MTPEGSGAGGPAHRAARQFGAMHRPVAGFRKALVDHASDLLVAGGIAGLDVEGAGDAQYENGQIDPWNPVGERKTAAEEVHVGQAEVDHIGLREESEGGRR